MLTKFFLGIAIIAFTTYCGYLLSKKYRRRKVFYEQFYTFNERFLNEITYYKRPLIEWIASYTYDGEFEILLRIFIDRITQKDSKHPHESVESTFSFLLKEEKQEIENYLLMLGKGDSLSQKNYFSSLKESLKSKCTETEKNAKKYADLYVKLGFLCGLAFLILML
jgi:stage III sporulation protein AB